MTDWDSTSSPVPLRVRTRPAHIAQLFNQRQVVPIVPPLHQLITPVTVPGDAAEGDGLERGLGPEPVPGVGTGRPPPDDNILPVRHDRLHPHAQVGKGSEEVSVYELEGIDADDVTRLQVTDALRRE
jgi:hypothetical protein